jgi:uncharacterized OsmC-like protein
MSVENIRSSMEKTISYLKANPDKAKIKGKAATAVLENGLKVRTTGPKDQMIVSDIPSTLGGGESAPAPGWYMQAALAACYASGIALKAAQESIELSTLEVSIDAESDARGIGAKGVEEEKLRDLVDQVYQYSWVGNAVRRSVPIKTEVEIV